MLRAAHSIFNTQDLLNEIRRRFETPTLDACLFFRSFINDTYQLAAGDRRYYLRVYQAGWRTRPEIAAEMGAIEAIYQLGGAVARPVALRDGGFVLDLVAPEATRHAVLFHEAPGVDLTYGVTEGSVNARRYGRAVGELHNVTSCVEAVPSRQPLDLQSMLDAPKQIVASRLSDKDRDDFVRLCARVQQRVVGEQALTLAFCHGDLNGSNIHFEQDRPAVIDFDCCGWGWLSSDIAAFARGVTLRSFPSAAASALIRAFLQGYEVERRIASADRNALPAFLLMQRIWVSSLHLDGHHRWGNINYGAEYAKRLVHWLRAWEPVLDGKPDWL